MSFDGIVNRGEFLSNHYLDALLAADLGGIRQHWDDAEQGGEPTARTRLRTLGRAYFAARAYAAEAPPSGRVDAVRRLNDLVLTAFGFPPRREELALARATTDTLRVPVASRVDTSTGLFLVALDAGMAVDVDDLFSVTADDTTPAGLLLDALWRDADKKSVSAAADAVSELFAVDEPPRYVLIAGGPIVLLAERAKWAEGRFLAVDVDGVLERNDNSARGEIETVAALVSADALVPGALGDAEGQSMLDELVDKSYKHAVGVSKELRNGIRESIEILANEVIAQRLERTRQRHETRFAGAQVDPRDLTRQCLRWLYRLLVLLYAESRRELGIVPVDDDAYLAGYSLDRLRELTLVDLHTDVARDGSHLHDSLKTLFALVNDGYHADHAEQTFALHDVSEEASREEYLLFPGLDAGLFDASAAQLLDDVPLRNEAVQKVLALLMLSPEGKGKGKKHKDRGFISYAQLGINQLGAVYEGLMAYTGFFAAEDLYEVAKHGDPSDGTWVLPVAQAEGYPDDVFVTRTDPLTGRTERVLHEKGSFVFRLAGRDRQRSASYYTPEVLTRCVVKHALAELLGLDDYAPEHGSSGIIEATQILDLTICEPALGSGAFLNEAINQLADEYLRRRQAELGDTLDPESYRLERQKVKAHLALHQCYGVDLNATAVELAEVSLWLNCMYPGLKAPWFGMQLRRGNSLIGCRRATWRTSQLADRPWAKTKKGEVSPPVDRKLSNGPLDTDEIHHFLLPGHGWAAVADRKEARELRPDETAALKAWRKAVLAAPKKSDAARLRPLAAATEELWARAADRIRLTQRSLRRPLDLYGVTIEGSTNPRTRAQAEQLLNNPDSSLGRLRTLMDAWVGLWFWPLDTGTRPPNWNDWLTVTEQLVGVEHRHGPTGQLSFDDLEALLAAEDRDEGRVPVAELRERHAWLAVAVDAAQGEGAWHWELEFAPAFQRGGFDLQVGNPPWVDWEWHDDEVIAEFAPAVGLGLAEVRTSLVSRETRSYLLSALTSHGAANDIMGSPLSVRATHGLPVNTYRLFVETGFRRIDDSGTLALLHPDAHWSDMRCADLRALLYSTLRREIRFINQLKLFADIGNTRRYAIGVYRSVSPSTDFYHLCRCVHPLVADESFVREHAGELRPPRAVSGAWSLAGHPDRIVHYGDEQLATIGRYAGTDVSPTTGQQVPRLPELYSKHDLQGLAALRRQPSILSMELDSGIKETASQERGLILKDPGHHDVEVLQSPHITLANYLGQESKAPFQSHRDYRPLNPEEYSLGESPRLALFKLLDHQAQRVEGFRLAFRRRTDVEGERTLQVCIVPPNSYFVDSIHALLQLPLRRLVGLAGLWGTLAVDWLVRTFGKGDIQHDVVQMLPSPELSDDLYTPVALRALRLNCVSEQCSSLWRQSWTDLWRHDTWTDASPDVVPLGGVGQDWEPTTPLRLDLDRRSALLELDALGALVLGLSAEQLSAMYRTQFAVLRKYEYKMAFDAEGRKLCGYHQSAGYRQSQLQDQAKSGGLPPEWKSLWSLFEQYELDRSSVDWLGHYTPPFYRPDREMEMTRAYEEFRRRRDAGEYGDDG